MGYDRHWIRIVNEKSSFNIDGNKDDISKVWKDLCRIILKNRVQRVLVDFGKGNYVSFNLPDDKTKMIKYFNLNEDVSQTTDTYCSWLNADTKKVLNVKISHHITMLDYLEKNGEDVNPHTDADIIMELGFKQHWIRIVYDRMDFNIEGHKDDISKVWKDLCRIILKNKVYKVNVDFVDGGYEIFNLPDDKTKMINFLNQVSENCDAGATGAGSIASVVSLLGTIQKRTKKKKPSIFI